jgi:toxin HigB-1
MQVAFANSKLEALFITGAGAEGYPPEVYKRFILVIRLILNIKDERELYVLKGSRVEKLKSNRQDQRSLRLNKQFRLIFTLESTTNQSGEEIKITKVFFIHEIVDYH